VPPAFLLDKAIKQLQLSARNAHDGGSLVESIERRTREHHETPHFRGGEE